MDLRQMIDAMRQREHRPIATTIKAGQTAWPKFKERLGVRPANPEPMWVPSNLSLLGIRVHVLEPNVWPPNLVAVVDQEGNAMTAWIING